MKPKTRYTKSGDVSIAYQVVGDGPLDLVYVIGWLSNIDFVWDEPLYARFLHRLASFSRLIIFDKRGTGLSDRVSINELPTMEQRMDDVRAVMDAAGSERAALLGISEGGPLCILFAATYPERTSALISISGYASATRVMNQIGARTKEEWDRTLDWMENHWGDEAARVFLRDRAPSVYHDQAFRTWWEAYLRASASPAAAVALTRMNEQIDVRAALPAVSAPTLIIHAEGDRAVDVANSRYLARMIDNAKFIELDSQDHLPWVTDADADIVVAAVEELVTGRQTARPDSSRVLATILYTDTVGSTERLATMGDAGSRGEIEQHRRIAEREVAHQRGRLVKWTGDGILATFDGPARAIRAAMSMREALRPIGIEIRSGLHTGECEIVGDDLAGIALSIGARIEASAGAGEILVSSTVRDLVAGSGIDLEDRGMHGLKGVPEEWRLFAVTGR